MQPIPALIKTIQPPRCTEDGTSVCGLCDEPIEADPFTIGFHPNSQLEVTVQCHRDCVETLRDGITAALEPATITQFPTG